jgi:hypothetical protein
MMWTHTGRPADGRIRVKYTYFLLTYYRFLPEQ